MQIYKYTNIIDWLTTLTLITFRFPARSNCSKNYYPAEAYNQSKLAQVLFTKHINLQFEEDEEPIQSHSLHPGVVNTDLFEHSSTTYVPWVRQLLFKV